MIISSTPEIDKLVQQLETLLGCGINNLERIGNGKNSQVFHLICENGDSFAVKRYFQHPADDRDRLNIEFSSLQFIWQNNIRCVPKPIIASHGLGIAVYEYINGEKIQRDSPGVKDIDEAVDFLWKLAELRNVLGGQTLPAASGASFSISGISQNITARLTRLLAASSDSLQSSALSKFLLNEFSPAFNEILEWSKAKAIKAGLSYIEDQPLRERTLSPSDFGFHNALKDKVNGKITFVDFEYFGWDDPAKMICDFLLHPAMQLNNECKIRFSTSLIGLFKSINPSIHQRAIIVYPLFGLMWTMIILNEFLPFGLERHHFVKSSSLQREALQNSQFEKAKAMLDRVCAEYKSPPLLSSK